MIEFQQSDRKILEKETRSYSFRPDQVQLHLFTASSATSRRKRSLPSSPVLIIPPKLQEPDLATQQSLD